MNERMTVRIGKCSNLILLYYSCLKDHRVYVFKIVFSRKGSFRSSRGHDTNLVKYDNMKPSFAQINDELELGRHQ